MSRKRKMASITSAGLVFAMLLSQSAVADLGTEQVKAAEEAAKWVDTEYVVNGDFESGADNWDINIPKDTENWLYGSGAEKGYYCIWENKTEEQKDVSISQTVKLPAGTYKLGIKSTGAAGGLKLSAGEYVSTDLKASEWADDQSKWESIETGEFTLDKESDVKVFVSGKLTAWNKGSAIDDIVLYEREADDTDSSEENQKGYTISVNQTEVAVENGDTVNLEAKITYDEKEINELPEGVNLWWWVDTWNDHTDGLSDGTLENDKNSGKTLKAAYTTKSAGKYYVVAQLKDANDNELGSVCTTITSKAPEIDTSVDNDDIVVAKVKDLSPDFIMEMDMVVEITMWQPQRKLLMHAAAQA